MGLMVHRWVKSPTSEGTADELRTAYHSSEQLLGSCNRAGGTQIVTDAGRTLTRSFLVAGRAPPSSS